MSTICVIGGIDDALRLVRALDIDNHIVVVDPDIDDRRVPGISVVQSIDDFDDPIDALIDIGIDADYMLVDPERLASAALIAVNAVDETATQAAESLPEVVLAGRSVVAISYLPALFERAVVLEMSVSMQTRERHSRAVESVSALFPGKRVEHVEDRLGHVSARVLAMVINEAAFALMEGVATAADIDASMKLGASYPEGPLTLADAIGSAWIVQLLDGLYEEYHDERYRACVLLRQHARSRSAFHQAQN